MYLPPRTPVIIAARRTPIGRVNGDLRYLGVEELAAPVLRAVVEDASVEAAAIEEVILGNAAGPGGNVARLTLLEAGFPISTPGVTVDRQCGSGLEAIIQACHMIQAGAADVVMAGGVESCSTAPLRTRTNPQSGESESYTRAPFSPETVGDPEMGEAAENVAEQFGIDRVRQDEFALRSHQKAVESQSNGRFDAEIVPVSMNGASVSQDSCPREDSSLEKLSQLDPVFRTGGTVTAGNACPINDGAAAVLVVSTHWLQRNPRPSGLVVEGTSAAGVDPNILGMGPVPAVQKLLERTGAGLDEIDVIEFNEAFAAQVLACVDELGLDSDKLNIGGGALAIGHPYGASGAILMVRLFTELARQNKGSFNRGLATIGIGGGQGLALMCRAL